MGGKTANYDESKVKTLSSLEHIRLRTGMYIGRLGDGSNQNDGIYVLLKEIIDNAVDEFIMGNGDHIDIEVKENQVRVRDYGRGIPLGKLVDCVSIINTGAKYNDEVFQFSVGLNGVGTKAVNALSSHYLNGTGDYTVGRNVLNVEIMCLLYERTGDERLLALAKKSSSYADAIAVVIDADDWTIERNSAGIIQRRKVGGWVIKQMKRNKRAFRCQFAQPYTGRGYGSLILYGV